MEPKALASVSENILPTEGERRVSARNSGGGGQHKHGATKFCLLGNKCRGPFTT
jgi:hypothetical protein